MVGATLLLLLLIALRCALLASPAAAAAEPGPLLTTFGEPGSAAGQLSENSAIAADPANGHIFVVEGGSKTNNRVDEFSPWGRFLKAFGWGVRDGASELQTCGPSAMPPSPCRAGLKGDGAGQFDRPQGVTVGEDGDIWVFEPRGRSGTEAQPRLQKFSPAGEFLLMIGGGVDSGPHHPGNLCTAEFIAEGDLCGAAVAGTGPDEFDVDPSVLGTPLGNQIAFGSNGDLYVGEQNAIQKITAAGEYDGRIKFSDVVDPEGSFPASGTVGALAISPEDGDIYLSFQGLSPPRHPVRRLTADGETVGAPLDVPATASIAVSPDGDVWADTYSFDEHEQGELWEFDSTGLQLGRCCRTPYLPPTLESQAQPGGLAINPIGDVYRGIESGRLPGGTLIEQIALYGPPPVAYEPPPSVPPSITAQFAASVRTTSAELKAEINPHFFTDTRTFVEWGTAPCSSGGCDQKLPLPPGELLTGTVQGSPVISEGFDLSDLTPGTTYHFRFVAESTGSGGEPVRGVGGTVASDGDEAMFTTQLPETPSAGDCPNEALRSGLAARLPDCRGYELVSSADKEGGSILTNSTLNGTPLGLDQTAPSGDSMTFSSGSAFGGSEGGPYVVQYLSGRRPDGEWAVSPLSPPLGETKFSSEAVNLGPEFEAFSTDLSRAWLFNPSALTLGPHAIDGYANIYERDNATGLFSGLDPSASPGIPSSRFLMEVQAVSADGRTALVRANAALSADAPELSSPVNSVYQLYEAVEGGPLKLVSVLPDGTPATTSSSAGTANGEDRSSAPGFFSAVGALSSDGSVIYWSTEESAIYRTDSQGVVAIPIPPETSARFQVANPDGSRMLFTTRSTGAAVVKSNLFEYNAETGKRRLIAPEIDGPVAAASDDLSRVYFVSTAALAPGAQVSEPNLYFDDQGVMNFIGVLPSAEVDSGSRPSLNSRYPTLHTSATDPSGRQFVFTSSGPLTGFDNRDAVSGQRDQEVYLWDATRGSHGKLLCLSCAPTGARPTGREVKSSNKGIVAPLAATVAPFENGIRQPEYVSADGTVVYFDSYTPLVVGDTNAAEDVYEWEAAGSGTCTSLSSGFSPSVEGCITLVSGGDTDADASFVEATPDASDVFFTTPEGLVAQDTDNDGIDLYDARVGGGAPRPEAPGGCESGSCQSASPPPIAPVPGSTVTREGNSPVRRCRAVKGSRTRQPGKHPAKSCKTGKRVHRHPRKHRRPKKHRGRTAHHGRKG